MLPTNAKLHFARFEFKYLLPEHLRRELESEIKYFMEFDPYVASIQDHYYVVRSLYFDDPYYSCYYDKVDGIHTRHKFRVRTYTNDVNKQSPQFLEVKGRYNNLVLKHRVMLNDEHHIVREKGDRLISKILKSLPDSEVGQQFEYELYRKRLRPVALVDYYRRPYISRFDPEFRLTFDSNLQGTLTKGMFPSSTETRRKMLTGYTVMEIKFRQHIPSWFHRLIQSYELRRVSVSKICEAMEVLELAQDPN